MRCSVIICQECSGLNSKKTIFITTNIKIIKFSADLVYIIIVCVKGTECISL